MEHGKGLLDVLLTEDIWELCVHLHIKENILAVKNLRDGRGRSCFNIFCWEYSVEYFIKLDSTLTIE